VNEARGIVYLVGAGPGDPGLITVRGRELLCAADVIVHDRLIPHELLRLARRGVEVIDVGKAPGSHRASQVQTNALLIDRASRGLCVVRLKGGDPLVYGRGFEEAAACREAGVACVTVPGVSSALAAPLSAGVSVTRRGVSRSFTVVTAETATGDEPVDFTKLAGGDTLIIMMGRERLEEIAACLVQGGREPSTPAACIERATTVHQRVVVGTLETIAALADREGLVAPMVTVIGEVARDAAALVSTAPLVGRRVVITRPRGASRDLERMLVSRGATVIRCPLIKIEYSPAAEEWRRGLGEYAWVVLTSRHGVSGFWKQLRAAGLDARALAGCKLAAIGPTTAKELRRIGLSPDLIAAEASGRGLAEALLGRDDIVGRRVLLPQGDIAMRSPSEVLRTGGALVEEWIVYRTVAAVPSAAARASIESGVDAILFFSPSAVRSFVEAGLSAGDAIVACVGPTTAAAAREVGLDVNIVAADHSSAGLVAALEEHLAVSEVRA